MRSLLRSALCAVWLGWPSAPAIAAPVNVNDPPEGRFLEDWAVIHLAGQKIGYAHSTMTRNGDDVETAMNMVMRLGRVNQPVKISLVQRTLETIAGIPREFGSTMDMATMQMVTEGKIKEGRVTIDTSQFGLKQSQVYDFPKGALMTWGVYRESILRGFDPGTQYELKVYAPELRKDGDVLTRTTVGEKEAFEHGGKSVQATRVAASMETPMGTMETIQWVDEDGRALRSKIPAPGIGDLELIATDQQAALSDFVPPELFMNTVVQANRDLDPKKLRRVRYRLSPKDQTVSLSELPSGGMQTVAKQSSDSAEIVVVRQRHEVRKDGGTNDCPNRSDYLGANLMINIEDPKLVELAKVAGGGETEPFALGDRLRRFVTDFVTAKNLNIGFATASEVARNREGDCSEHGVLLAALGRLNGLPSRVVVGLAYVPQLGGQRSVFGYHMWTQFFIDGRWIDFDAALRESDCSPTRIAFATSSLKDAGLADLSLPLLSTIGAIDIDIIEVEELAEQAD